LSASRDATSRTVPSATKSSITTDDLWGGEMLTSQRRDQNMHALHQDQFYVSGKNACEGTSNRYPFNGDERRSSVFWIVLENHLLKDASWMGEICSVKGARSHLAIALVRQLLCDRIKPEGPKTRIKRRSHDRVPARTAPQV
jgi:hypothetical protein